MTQPAGQGSGPRDDSRIVLVTGATSGIGFHTARELAVRGASVLVTGRDRGRGEDAVRAIASAAGHDRVGLIQVDHSTVGANSQLGTTVTDRLGRLGLVPRLDVLVSNAGGIFATPAVTADGYGLLTDIQSTRDYAGIRAHARAKLLTAAWTIALSRQQAGTGLAAATVNPGMAWTAMTQALTPQVVPSWRHAYPLVRFFQKRGDPARAARVCVELAWTAR
jgi:NAD(P)-dependent dehydrogenase (short-subunit alcohol dehydrogenase family)